MTKLVEETTPFGNNTRYVMLFISIACLTLIVGNSLALNFTIICMQPSSPSDAETNGTHLATADKQSADVFSVSEKSWLFSATAIGTIVGTLPITPAMSKFGFKRTLAVYGAISAVSTLLLPIASTFGFWPLFAIRGVPVATSFPAIPSIGVEWSPLKSSGLFIALISSHLQLAPLTMMPLAGQICESSLGWPALYYILGAATIGAIFTFCLLYEDSPRLHRSGSFFCRLSVFHFRKVSQKELFVIEHGKESTSSGERCGRVPYKAILTDYVVWGFFVAYFGGMVGFLIFFIYGPVYLHEALGFEVNATGFAAAMPFLLAICMKLVGGPLSDYTTCISQKARVKLFSSISQFTMAGCFIALALLPANYGLLIQVFFTGAQVFSALNCVGLDKCTQLACCQYGYVIQSIITLSNSAITLAVPMLVGFLAPDNTVEQWSRVFWIIGIIIIISTIVFDLTAEAEPRPWTLNTFGNAKIHPNDIRTHKISVGMKCPFGEPTANGKAVHN
ncbi:Protein T19D12.9 [Aphelenchoides avenae]|nr:Protein T19D12.9 [Aphelenchus avenae]